MISFNSHNKEMFSFRVYLPLNRFLTNWVLVVSKLGTVYADEWVECLLWLGILIAAGNQSLYQARRDGKSKPRSS